MRSRVCHPALFGFIIGNLLGALLIILCICIADYRQDVRNQLQNQHISETAWMDPPVRFHIYKISK